ncbi:DNA topoisomerase IV, partial [Sulfurimonas sp. C5]|nr:DNA topoisomerase IV [Sulfurimonas sp. C5]
MKILLLNDNPVVTKLVTLSAQKTSDSLDVIANVDEIETSESYDLLVIDDTKYTDGILDEIAAKVTYIKTLFIASRDAEKVANFSATLKKPFLPTDLVELFAVFGKEIANGVEDVAAIDDSDNDEEFVLDHNPVTDEILDLDDDLDEPFGDDLNLDDELEEPFEDDLELDDEIADLDDEFLLDDEESTGESVLDSEEAQKVKDLLDEAEDDLELDDNFEDLDEFSLEDTEDEIEDLDATFDEELDEEFGEEAEEEIEGLDELEGEDEELD